LRTSRRPGNRGRHGPGRPKVRPEASARGGQRACQRTAADRRLSAEFRGAEVPPFCTIEPGTASRHAGRRRTRPRVLNTVLPLHIVQGSASAQGATRQSPGIATGAARICARRAQLPHRRPEGRGEETPLHLCGPATDPCPRARSHTATEAAESMRAETPTRGRMGFAADAAPPMPEAAS
jgi:hypothetical protein